MKNPPTPHKKLIGPYSPETDNYGPIKMIKHFCTFDESEAIINSIKEWLMQKRQEHQKIVNWIKTKPNNDITLKVAEARVRQIDELLEELKQ